MGLELTDRQRWAIEKFDALAKASSQNKACGLVGISPAIMSPLRRGTYAGDAEAQYERLISYFEVKEAAAGLPSQRMLVREYVPTFISGQVYDVIRNCQLQGGLAIACGAAGIGKTKAAKKFVADYPNDAVYVAANPCFRNVKSLLKMLCSKLNVTERTIDEMWLGLVGKLRNGMVIIVDEAQHLPIKTIEALRSLSDDFDERGLTLGLCFVGNKETVTNFGGKKRAEFEQIANRTKHRKVYTTAHIKRTDIELLFPELHEEMQIDYLLQVARSIQAIRGAVNLYSNAADNEDTSYEGLVAMAKHMEMVI